MQSRSIAVLGPLVLVLASGAAWAQASSAEETCPLKTGSPIPAVTLVRPDGKPLELRAEVARKPTLLIFYRGGWCPFCNLHLSRLRDVVPQLEKRGVQVIAISPDRPEALKKALDKGPLNYQLASDHSAAAMKAFGLAWRADDATIGRLQGHGIDIEAASGEKHRLLPVPAAYLVGTDGLVRFSYANPNYKVRVSPEVLVSAAETMLDEKPAK